MKNKLDYEWTMIRINDVSDITGLGKSTVWRLVKAGLFPAPIKISARVTAWKAGDVKAWLESKEERK